MTRLLFTVLTFALLIGLLPMSNHMLPMQTMRMDAVTTSQITAFQNKPAQETTGDSSSGTCCDAMGSLSLACDFVISQCDYVVAHPGVERISDSLLVFQSTSSRPVSPPPKI